MCCYYQRLSAEDAADTAGLGFPAFEEYVKRLSEQVRKRNAVVFDPETTGKVFCRLDCYFTVTGYPFIYRYGDKMYILPCRKEPGEEEEEGCAVLAPAKSDCHAIPAGDHPAAFYRIHDTTFNISGKMNTAEVTINVPLVYDCRLRAPGTQRYPVTFQVQGSAPVSYPDNPDLILSFYNRILRYQIPVAGYNYFKRIDTRFKQYLFNRSRAMHNNPFVPIR
jgi:hypothetical protein